MITYERFRASDALREDLKAVLQNTTLLLALDAIRDLARPKRLPDPLPGAHPDTGAAREYYRLFGITQSLDLLQSMTEPPSNEHKEETLDDQPFFHTLPEPMKEAIRKQMNQPANP